MKETIRRHGLEKYEEEILGSVLPAIGFSVTRTAEESGAPVSKLFGRAWLPRAQQWPEHDGRPLDFLLQVDLSDVADRPGASVLPPSGMLSFFYDLKEQPWGFDPKDLGGFRIIYTPALDEMVPREVPDTECALAEYGLTFSDQEMVPHPESTSARDMTSRFSDSEMDAYFELMEGSEGPYRQGREDGFHHLLGHSQNVQADMQLEAQLVTNGLYCGDATGYRDPRAKGLESGAADWKLLLQLDTDDAAGFMWGDCGTLYYWIRKQDLAEREFGQVWMGLQCY